MDTFVSLAHRLLIRHRLGPFFLAIILVIVGFIIGATSHQVAYQRANHVIMNHYVSGSNDNKIYISLKDGSLYILILSDFTPKPTSNSLFSRNATLIYDPQETSDVKISATNSTTQLSGTGATVVQLITYGADGSSKAFISKEYATYPHGFYRNNWGIGLGFMLAGIALGIFLFFFARYRKPFSVTLLADLTTSPLASITAKNSQSSFPQQPPYTPTPEQASFPSTPLPYPQQVPFPSTLSLYPQQPPYTPTPEQVPFPSTLSPYPQQPPYTPNPQSNPVSGAGYNQPNRYTSQPGMPPSPPSWDFPTTQSEKSSYKQ